MPEVIYRSSYPSPPLAEQAIFEYLRPARRPALLNAYPDAQAALIDGVSGRTLSRGGLIDGARRLATGLRDLGLKKGDTACIFGLNSIEWAQAAYGCMAAGVIVTPANAAYSAGEITHQINNSGAQLIFIDAALLPVLDAARPKLERKFDESRVVILAEPGQGGRFKTVQEIFGATPGEPEAFDGEDAHSTALLCYSSGTTGLAKGVMITHHNLLAFLQAGIVSYTRMKHGKERALGILPFSHIYGYTMLLCYPFAVGCPLVYLPRFEEVSMLKAIEKYKVNFACIVPPVLIILIHSQAAKNYDLTSLHSVLCGAAPLSGELTDRFMKLYPHCDIIQGYGLTESTTGITTAAEVRVGMCGVLMPTYEARLVTEEGVDAAPGERGEMWVRSPCVMKGYHNNPAATANTMAPGGWLKTGDVLTVDADGWFRVVDRLKELIKYKGFQVPPAELEALLLTHPQILDAGVVGVYDAAQATELPRAYVVAAPAVDVSNPKAKAKFEADVAAWVAERVAQHKRLRGGVDAIPAIPKSPSGKILRKDLRAKGQAERDAAQGAAKARL